MLLPLSIKVPLPVLVNDKEVAAPFSITPLKVVLVLRFPIVIKGVALAVALVIVPVPVKEPTV